MKSIDSLTINTIRALAADTVQKANSGHPGIALGAAPMSYALFAKFMKHNPHNPKWDNRDRFVLSAGHGSALIYSLLHIFGFGLEMDELKSFRQWGSKTPGHPEYAHTAGVETTTGPLGQGISNAVGMAIAEANLAATFNKPGFDIVDHYTYAISGDGCLQEGISAEACSLAGHLKLGKLTLLYDKNNITIEGDTDVAFTEDVGMRYEAYGWQVLKVADGNEDLDSIEAALEKAKAEKDKPTLIIVNTKIGFGCPLQGKSKCHGSPLGADNIKVLKENIGFDPEVNFYVPEEVYEYTAKLADKGAKTEQEWNALFAAYEKEYPEMAALYKKYYAPVSEEIFDEEYYKFDKALATRQSSSAVLQKLADKVPNLMGGSADLAPSNLSDMKNREYFGPDNYAGTNMHFGIREFAMCAIANGMAVHGGLHPYAATFFVFSDYCKHAIRLAALMKLPIIYIMTHDSIGVGEDGPTHEPIEQLAAIRSMPGAYMWRPSDSKETAAAYQFALTQADGPCVLALTRQTLPLYEETGKDAFKGGYIVKDSKGSKPELILIGTGSELELCYKAYDELTLKGIDVRVVSMPCMELFEAQSDEYKEKVLPRSVRARVAVEAGSSFGWERYVGLDGATVCIDHFGASAPFSVLFEKFGFTTENVVKKALDVLNK